METTNTLDPFAAPEGITQATWEASLAAQTNPVGPGYHETVDHSDEYPLWKIAAMGGRISRVRILTEYDPGRGYRADISYIHAMLPDGRTVPVIVDAYPTFLYGKGGVKEAFIQWAREEGVFAKGIGLLDENVWSVLK